MSLLSTPNNANPFQSLVGVSRREIRGFVVLLLALAGLVTLPLLVQRWTQPAAAPATSTDEVRSLDQLVGHLERTEENRRRAWSARAPRGTADRARADRYQPVRRPEASQPIVPLTRLTPFDPNTLSAVGWQRRGLPADVARRLVSYGRKAGGFRYREQLQRIHGFDPQLFARLAPFILLPTRDEAYGRREARPAPAASPAAVVAPALTATPAPAAEPSKPGYVRKLKVGQAFDLNTADTLTLMQLRGIGRKRAARIVALREQLGGFVAPEQLADVWGLDAALLDTLMRLGRIAPDFQPRQLPINSATVEELRVHPYVGYRLARVIVAYREQHGPFTRPADLLNIKLLDEAAYQKLLPYVVLR